MESSASASASMLRVLGGHSTSGIEENVRGLSSQRDMSSLNNKLSFIFLCDGPCTASSWRDDDKSMYWARRDALARITAMSLWQGPGDDNCISDDCSLLFHEAAVSTGNNEKEELLAAIAMTGPQLVSALPIPTESSLIRRWKAAANVAVKYPQQAEIGNVPFKTQRVQKEDSDSEMPCGIQMSFTPWRETAFLSHTLTAPRSSKDNNSSSSPPVNMGTSITCSKSIINDESAQNNSKNSKIGKTCQDVTDTYETFDKRFILKTMQKQCSVEFLRKHLLTGSEDLVLKKRNKASILAAYAEWRNEKNVSKSEESVVAKECTARDSVYSNNNSSSSSNSSSSNISSSSSSSSSSSRLEDTFTVLYNRSRSISTQCSRTSVLLLHEDYPEELPIFSSSNSNSKKYRENGSLNKEVHVVGSSDIMVRSSNDSHRVVCVLGAVRDASDVEVGAAIQAAERMGIRCVGANLGRTAEFTSKIVATLVGHALAGQLGRAVDCLSDVRASMTLQNPLIHQENTLLNKTVQPMKVVAKIKKLDPQRVGGWSWDGSSNKTSKKNVKVENSGVTGQVVRTNDGVSTGNTVVQNVKDCILFHVVLWLPYCASDVRVEVEYREQFHILIQCAVCTLWRSRIASEDSHEKKVTAVKNNENEDIGYKSNPKISKKTKTKGIRNCSNNDNDNDNSENDDNSHSKKRKFQESEKSDVASKNLVQPTLSLVFKDGSTASITQELLTLSMARKRMAAPTEYQVLSSIIELLNDPILQLIRNIPNISPKDKMDIVKDDSSFSDHNNREKKVVELSGLNTRNDILKSDNRSDNDNDENGMWIDSLKYLLPSGLNKKQRKKIHIIDVNDLLSTTTQDIQNINHTENNRKERELIQSENGENLLPSLSSIVYGFHNPSILHGFSHDNIQKENNCKNNNKNNDNGVKNNENDEEIPSQVLVLLRPAVHYISKTTNKQNQSVKSPFSSLKTTVFNSKTVKSLGQSATSLPGNDMDFYTKIINRRQSEIEKIKLNKILNEYMYGKNSKKHDISAKSVLYCSASLFSSIPSEESSSTSASYGNVLLQCMGNNTKTTQHTDVISSKHTTERNTSVDFKLNLKLNLKSNYVSPGIAVCVLQHWAYNRMLLPTLQTAQNNYLHSTTM